MDNSKFIRLMPLLFALSGTIIGCVSQSPKIPSTSRSISPKDSFVDFRFKHYVNGAYVDEKDLPKGVISLTQTDRYPSNTFHFHDNTGKEVKTIREDHFPIKNPIFKLPFPKNTHTQESSNYYLPLSTFDYKTGTEQPQISTTTKLKAFSSLNKYNLHVKKPETATYILGSPSESLVVVTPPLDQFLVRCETASIFYEHAEAKEDTAGNLMGNSLLDCSAITVYNHLGAVVQEILVPDKLVKTAWISNDEKYLFCGYMVGFVGDEGLGAMSDGFMIIELSSKTITPVDIPALKECSGDISGFFADNYFQMQCEGRKFLYLNPYNRAYYIVQYEWNAIKDKKPLLYNSFTPFEGVKNDLSQYQGHAY